MKAALMVILLLAGCTAEAPAPAPVTVPPELRVCPDATPAPPPPPAPRTVGQIIGWAKALLVARDKTADALAECRHRLQQRNGLGGVVPETSTGAEGSGV